MTNKDETNALKSISKAVNDLNQLNLVQRKLFDRIEHSHQNFFIQGQAGTPPRARSGRRKGIPRMDPEA